MKKIILTSALFIAIAFSNVVNAQSTRTLSKRTADGKIRCFTTEHEQYLKTIDPKRESKEEFEQWLAPKVAEAKAARQSGKTATIITIPVVVHVISNGDAVGANENISDAQILSQITVLNQDFRKLLGSRGYNTNSVGADVEIEFCMAQRKPDGVTATNGIDRVTRTSPSSYATEVQTETMKASTSWDPTQYFNIWTVFFSNSTSAEMNGVLGYAQFPTGSGLTGLSGVGTPTTANTDGLVVDYRYFGTSDIVTSLSTNAPYDKGRTATHEIGHCFGLRHIWGDGGSQQFNTKDCVNNTDYCADTPAAGWDNYDCATTYDTCPSSPGNDMVENYMDYSEDACMNIFTVNQKDRIVAVMNNSPRRASLKTSLACQAPLANNEFEYFNSIKIVPNPVKDFLNINMGQLELPDSLTIYNELGQTICSKKVSNNNDLSVSTESYSTGNYVVILTKNNASRAYKFIKE